MSAVSRSSAGCAALPRDCFEDVVRHVVGRVHDVVHVQLGEHRLEAQRERVRPTAEQVAIGVGHPEHVGDHLEGEREREIGDDLQPVAACDDGLERVVDERLDARRELLDGSWGEDLLDDPADARVVGRIEVEDAAGSPLGAVAEHRRGVRRAG